MVKTFTLNQQSNLKRTLAIMSAKGGVGKSTLTALIATHLAKAGKKVGILDADIIGSSISRIFALKEKVMGQAGLILPVTTPLGIKVIASQLLLDQADDPIVWRSPLVLDLIRQFYVDVIWGDLDYLLIDLPPGTGDVTMTVLESLKVDEIIMITTPQETVSGIVAKGIQMAKMIHKPIRGVIENQSYFLCESCGKTHPLFQSDMQKPLWERYELPLLAQLPLDPQLPNLLDRGKIETIMSAPLAAMINTWRD